MKIAAIFLVAFLATSYASLIPSNEAAVAEQKSTVSNIILAACLEKKFNQIKKDVAIVTGSVDSLKAIVANNQQKLQECQQIGGDNPSIIDQIAQAACSVDVAKNLQAEVLAAVDTLTTAIDELIHVRSSIAQCFA